MPEGENGRTRFTVRISERLAEYLDAVVSVGIHGSTTAEVARKFIENEIERLVKESIIRLPPNAGAVRAHADDAKGCRARRLRRDQKK